MGGPADQDPKTRSRVLGPPREKEERRAFFFWPDGGLTIVLPQSGSIVIGRGKTCDVRIDHDSVSRAHAALHIGAAVHVEDLGSSNGTRIGGRTLRRNERELVPAGAMVELGDATMLVQGGGDPHEAGEQGDAPASAGPAGSGEHVTLPPPPVRAADPGTAMSRLDKLVAVVAKGRLAVLVLGETGVGKEVLSERLHAASPRAQGPLVKLHCASFPETLLEAELFGYERGAFTGAVAAKAGLFEVGHGGTVFLDEVGELPLVTQAKLLRVLETHEVMRLGALRPKKVDVRIISATNRDPEQMVAAGTFRADLYYRLNGITLSVPPLRERTNEIPALVRTFVQDTSSYLGVPAAEPTEAALRELSQRSWPGNIRELRNEVERAVTIGMGAPLDVSHLHAARPDAGGPPSAEGAARSGEGLHEQVSSLERERILNALEQTGGNQTKAAEMLGIARRTLISRMEDYNLPRPRKR